MDHIFISYSKEDREYASKLSRKLSQQGFDVWIDDQIDYGADWEQEIFAAIERCLAFVVIMTPRSHDSKWVRLECHHADKHGKPSFPILLEGQEFPRYSLTEYLDVRDGCLPPESFYDRLAKYVPRKANPKIAFDQMTPEETMEWMEELAKRSSSIRVIRDEDELYTEAVTMVRRVGRASISLLQRRLRIGYVRAARLMAHMEERGVVGPQVEAKKAREVLS